MKTRMIGDEIYLDDIRVGSIDDVTRGHGALLPDVLRSGIKIASEGGCGLLHERAVNRRLTDAILKATPLLDKSNRKAKRLLESALEW